MVIPGKFHSKKLYEWDKLWEKKFSIPERGLSFDLKIGKRPVCDVGRKFFFVEKKVDRLFFEVKFTGDYSNVATVPTLFRDHRQKSKKTNFLLFFLLLTVILK